MFCFKVLLSQVVMVHTAVYKIVAIKVAKCKKRKELCYWISDLYEALKPNDGSGM